MQDYGKQEVQRMLKLLLFAVLTLVNIPSFVSAQFFEQGQFVKDIENRVLWLLPQRVHNQVLGKCVNPKKY